MITKAEYNHKRLKGTSQGMNVLSCLCFFISAAFTIMLMFDSAAVPLKQMLSVIMAICLELAKVYFFRFIGDQAAEAERGGNIPGKYALYALTFFLFVASTFGSIHYYMKTEAEKTGQDKVKDSSYTALNNDVTSIDTQISQLLELAKNQQAKHYITASKRTLAQVEELRKQKKSAVDGVSGYKPTSSSDSFYALISKFVGCEQDSARGGMYLFLSILLEFCGIASAFYGSYSKAKIMDIELAGMPDGDYKPDYGIRSADGNFYINPRGVAAPAFSQAPAFAQREPEPEPEPVKPEKKVGFIPPKSAEGVNLEEIAERIKADLKQKQATGTGYSNKAAKPDAIKFSSPVPDPVTRTGTGTGIPVPDPEPVAGMKLKIKTPVSVPDENEDGDDMDIDDLTRQYIEASFPVKSDGSLTGWGKIAKKLGISDDIARMIRSRLKKAGLIRVDGSKTFPEKTQAEMIQAVS